jgi:hypothetical protein
MTAADSTTSTWADVIVESAAANTPPVERETVTDTIELPLVDADYARIAKSNASDDDTAMSLEADIAALKEETKEKKAELAVVLKRIRERHSSIRSGKMLVSGTWFVDEHFETNTVRYVDRETGKIMHERAMRTDERQMSLGLDVPDEMADDDDEGGDIEDRLDRAIADGDEEDDLSQSDVSDPDAVLAAADNVASPIAAEPPSKPIKRTRKVS